MDARVKWNFMPMELGDGCRVLCRLSLGKNAYRRFLASRLRGNDGVRALTDGDGTRSLTECWIKLNMRCVSEATNTTDRYASLMPLRIGLTLH
jgi:hypothetical protein